MTIQNKQEINIESYTLDPLDKMTEQDALIIIALYVCITSEVYNGYHHSIDRTMDLAMKENLIHESLETEIERKNFIRAAHLAASLNLNNDEIEKLRNQALCRMAALCRNAHGTKILAQSYGYSKQEVKQILEEHARQTEKSEDSRLSKACYDSSSGKYLTFVEWINHFLEKWNKLQVRCTPVN